MLPYQATLTGLLYKFWANACLFDKYVMKQNKMQITHFLVASNSIDFDHLCLGIMYR